MTTLNAIETVRFGTVQFGPEDVVSFEEGLIGLPQLTTFVLIQHKEDSPFRWMQSLEQGELAFLVVDPAVYTQNYNPEMPESATTALNLSEDTPILVYTICTIPNGNPRGMTLNLAGPIVINADSRRARQVVLEDESCPVRFEVFADQESKVA